MVLRHVYMKVQGLSLQMGERKAGRQVRKWNRDGRMAKFLGLFIVMRIELMTMNPLVQYSDRESLSVLKSGSWWSTWLLSFPHWPTKGPLCLQQGKLTSSSLHQSPHPHHTPSCGVQGQRFLSNHKGNRRSVSWISGPLMRIWLTFF